MFFPKTVNSLFNGMKDNKDTHCVQCAMINVLMNFHSMGTRHITHSKSSILRLFMKNYFTTLHVYIGPVFNLTLDTHSIMCTFIDRISIVMLTGQTFKNLEVGSGA